MAKVGRNDPCPCGSGMKYKKCCLDKKPRQQIVMIGSPEPLSGLLGDFLQVYLKEEVFVPVIGRHKDSFGLLKYLP
jgi:hypothetical protein